MLYGDKMLNDESNQRTLTATINYIKKHLLRLRLSITLKKRNSLSRSYLKYFKVILSTGQVENSKIAETTQIMETAVEQENYKFWQ